MSERWDADAVASIAATPWTERAQRELTVKFTDPDDDVTSQQKTSSPALLRAFRVMKQDTTKYGLTSGYPQCTHVQLHGGAKARMSHNEICRRRMMEEIMKDNRANKDRV